MFDHFVWSVVVVPPLVVLVVRLLADRLPPSTAARAVAWSAAVVAAASTVNLLLFAMKAVAQVPAVAHAAGWSARVVTADTAAEPWVPWLSVALLAAVAVSVTLRWRRHRDVLALGRSADPGPLVVLPDPEAKAFAVPGRPGYVVVTTGMRSLLTDRQFDALIAHEHAHLTGRHHRLARLSGLAAAAHPALWWVARHVDYLLERAADEQAATEVGSRRTVAHAIGAAALATAGTGASAAGTGRSMLHVAIPAGIVPRRVSLLLTPRTWRGARLLPLLPAGLAAFSVAWSVEAALDLVELLMAAHNAR
ncbi:M56 family metallopeptidase [Dactylosporangium sp. NPDC005555]|uniref:M56 family metallopeptidase n=1 Tax=Dactylosporangium sp. NPDC005555 TaxID=3154889 RepID=UPI0033A32B99